EPPAKPPQLQAVGAWSMARNVVPGGIVSDTTVLVAAVGPALAAWMLYVSSSPGAGKAGECVFVTDRSARASTTVTDALAELLKALASGVPDEALAVLATT